MIAFQCNIANATGTVPVAKGNPARRCGDDPKYQRPADPANCTYGARVPSYWYQFEENNVRLCLGDVDDLHSKDLYSVLRR